MGSEQAVGRHRSLKPAPTFVALPQFFNMKQVGPPRARPAVGASIRCDREAILDIDT
jgi:hypothetical protein